MLATMTGHERIRFLVEYPRLAVGQRAVDACRADDDHASLLETDMTRVPDEYLREALESDRHWGIKLRVDDYRKALRETLRLERLFTGPTARCWPRSVNRWRPKSQRRRNDGRRRIGGAGRLARQTGTRS